VGTISGVARVNGIDGYSFVLTAVDNVPTYSLLAMASLCRSRR
jgi:hypothetical protein